MRTGSPHDEAQETNVETRPVTAQSGSIFRAFPRAGKGALLGTAALLISLLTPPPYRSPYLLAYPVVILSAWAWGLPASIACAIVSGGLIEFFIYHTGRIPPAPIPQGWGFRTCIYLGGAVLVGVLTRSAARQRERTRTANLNQRLRIAEVEAAVATQKAYATELALENEVRAKMALDGANVGLWEWDIVAGKSVWSNGFYRLHGLEPGTPITAETRRRILHPEDFQRLELAVEAAAEDRGSLLEEYRVVLPEGGIRWVATHGTAVAGPDGKIVKISGYGGDVTRRKLADLALLQNEKMAVAGRLIATVAHEINNPLDAAMNILYLIRSGVSEDEQAELLGEAELQLERISQITRHTLNFSRVSIRAALCKPSTLVDDTLRLLGPKLRLAGIKVETEVRADSEFFCERREILQILTNIFNNAVEATKGPGRLRVRIADSVDWRHRKHAGMRITIADTGAGMSAEVLARVSEPFFTTKQDTGTGLGMWVVRELVQKQHGAISIRSSTAAEHRGTVVSLFIPFALDTVAPGAEGAKVQNQAAF